MAVQNHQLLLNGVDRSSHLQPEWDIESTFGQHGGTFQFTLMDAGAGVPTFIPQEMQAVTLTDVTSGAILFSGLVVEVVMMDIRIGVYTWRVSCRDFTLFMDKAVVFGDFANLTADCIINNLVSQIPGNRVWAGGCAPVLGGAITSNHVQPGPQLGRVVINYESCTAAINKVTRMASIDAIWGWFVDSNRDLHWYNQTQATISANWFSDQVSESPEAGFTLGRYHPSDNFRYLWDANDIRTRVSVRGGNSSINNTRTDSWTADGNTAVWPITYPVHDKKALTLTVGGVGTPVSVDVGSSSPSTTWVVSKTVPGWSPVKGQWWLRDTSGNPANGTFITLQYTYLLPVITQVDDTTAQAKYASLNNKGIFWTAVNDTAIVDVFTAKSRGQRDLQLYSKAWETVTFRTIPGQFGGHVAAGDLITFVSSVVPDRSNNNAIGSLGILALVRTVRCSMSNAARGYRVYEVEALRVS